MKHIPMKHALPTARTLLAAALALAVAACAVPPRLEHPALRDDVPLAGLPTRAQADWPDPAWWRAYRDPQLDDLIERAMRQAPDLALAQSRLRGAEQSARAAAAEAGLTVNGSAQVTRQRMSDHGLIPSQFLGFSWYNQGDLGVQLQYDIDWWGKHRAEVESALDQARAAQAQQSAAALAIQYAVADTYFGWQADQARLQLAEQQLAVQQGLLRIAELRVRQGVDRPDEAQKARAQLAAAREVRAALAGSASIRLAALAALVGVSPAELPTLHPRPLPAIAGGLPANAGIDLIARRPDIAATRWQVEAALRQTDVARAQFLPDLSLGAMAGLSSIDLDKLFTTGSRVFSLTPALHLPIFNSGLLKANYGISRAQLEGAVAQYESTVLAAAREVSTQALTAQTLAARRDEQQAQLAADRQLADSARARVRQGVSDARESLAAQAQLLQQRDSETQLHAQAVAADLALVKALGGGYRMAEQPPAVAANASAPTAPTTHSGDADERH